MTINIVKTQDDLDLSKPFFGRGWVESPREFINQNVGILIVFGSVALVRLKL
ncbi:hypothetical protein H6G76_20050 [Nostoc sp. FACHB-152]|uniref:hypothetical protein n=1 Tax=unclassified Nostoc TaxID=2593658 RepID=UPI001685DF37|nr:MULTISPECIES: hypothetical protein [unclassified Nostoc]MBD2449412.1 hypothetical protein [Nostoc sp. FACHB-152]MBD2470673.1 hypothetical protein [Nostoc sp. FACHB-145]